MTPITEQEVEAAQGMMERCLEAAGGDPLVALKVACEAAVLSVRHVSAGYVRARPPEGA